MVLLPCRASFYTTFINICGKHQSLNQQHDVNLVGGKHGNVVGHLAGGMYGNVVGLFVGSMNGNVR